MRDAHLARNPEPDKCDICKSLLEDIAYVKAACDAGRQSFDNVRAKVEAWENKLDTHQHFYRTAPPDPTDP
jgi:hypothetical protein